MSDFHQLRADIERLRAAAEVRQATLDQALDERARLAGLTARLTDQLADRDATIERLREAAWQPIETAPQTGVKLLLYWTTRGASTGYFESGTDAYGWRGDQDLCIPRDQHHCTHWMPLPLTPEAEEQGRKPTKRDDDRPDYHHGQ